MIKILAAFVAGAAVAAAGGYAVLAARNVDFSGSLESAPAAASSAAPSDPLQMSMPQMTQELKKQPPGHFDHYALGYVLSIEQGRAGLLREIESRGEHQEIKNYAAEEMAKGQQDIQKIYGWQKAWGYSHH